MPTPPKPYTVLKTEKKSHRTKAELAQREQGEKALLTGTSLKERPEVKRNMVAHKEFLRLNKLLKGIEKNDSIYEPVINRYCLLQAECADIEEQKEYLYNLVRELKKSFKEVAEDMGDRDTAAALLIEHSQQMAKLVASMLNLDKDLMSKRKMLLDIEKESIMTIAAALRSIPKKTEQTENPLLKVLRDG